MAPVIESKGIIKRFGAITALNKISFDVNQSEVFGFIGPDGSGKTTLFRLLSTLMLPDEGELKIMGVDSVRDRLYARQIQPVSGSYC
jgi:ABC-2 type transport system ATP-binding protein